MTFFRILVLCVCSLALHAQNTWLQRASFPAGARQGVSTFEINNKLYMVGGWDFTNYYKELWEFDPASNTWTQKATFPGQGRQGGIAFSINGIGYYGTGDIGGFPIGYLNDFWAYDPATDTWAQKGNFPGARSGAVAFALNGNGYAGTGTSSATTYLGDMWQYDPATDTWTAKAAFGGTPRRYATAFTIGTKGYVGTGQGATGHGNTFYEYDPASDSWTQKLGYPNGVSTCTSFSLNGKGYIGMGYNGTTYQQTFYEYNPLANSWTAKANFGGGIRGIAGGLAINGKGYVCAGYGGGLKNDMWEYAQSLPAAPVASFALPSGICTGNCTSITDQALNSPDSYTWYITGSSTPSTIVQSPYACYNTLGTYTVTQIVSNALGSDTLSKVITVKSNPSVSVSVAATTICDGQFVTAIASGASGYAWSSGQYTGTVSLAPSTTTSYTVTGTASNGCTNSQSFSILVHPKPTISIAGTHSICAGSSQVYTASGASSYTWSANAGGVNTNSVSVSPVVATTYSVTGSNSFGCTSTATLGVSILPKPPVNATSTASVCQGSAAIFTASGATSYTWSTGATTSTMSAIAAASTVYTVTGKGSNNCTNTATVSANVQPGPALTVTSSSSVICAGGTASLSAGGASTYTWSTGAFSPGISVSPAASTVYSVTGASSSNSCTSVGTISVQVSMPAIAIAGTGSVCAGAAATFTASGASTYTWSNGSTSANISDTPTSSTTYSVSGQDAYGCSDSATVSVNVWPLPTVTAAGAGSVCAGTAATFTANGASTYTWSTGSSGSNMNVVPTASTSYSVTGEDVHGCAGSATVSIGVWPLPTVTATGTGSICAGSSASLSAGGAATYSWSNGATGAGVSVSPALTSTYSVTGTDANNCTNTASITVAVIQNPAIVITGTNTVCAGTSASLTASGASTYSWSTGEVMPGIVVSPAVSTTYTVTGANAGGCAATQTLAVAVSNSCITTGINESQDLSQVLVYPNPASAVITIAGSMELQSAELLSLTGQVVICRPASGHHCQLQLSEVAGGIYFMNVYSAGRIVKREKIVVQR